jgi:hypothetical protein
MSAPHLTDEQLTAALLSNAGDDVHAHLAACADCARELAALKDGVDGYRQTTQRAAEAPDAFWQEQREQIHRRAATAPPMRRRRPGVWIAAAGLAAAASIALWLAVLRPALPPAPDPDDVLLVSVQQSLRRGVPAALEPAQFLVADIGATSAEEARP